MDGNTWPRCWGASRLFVGFILSNEKGEFEIIGAIFSVLFSTGVILYRAWPICRVRLSDSKTEPRFPIPSHPAPLGNLAMKTSRTTLRSPCTSTRVPLSATLISPSERFSFRAAPAVAGAMQT